MTEPPHRRRPRPAREGAQHGARPGDTAPPAPAAVSIYVVDRVEGTVAVLAADAGGPTVDVDAAALPPGCAVEGAVLSVPLEAGPARAPAWGRATRDRAEEARRRAEVAARLTRLQASDPGGDVTL